MKNRIRPYPHYKFPDEIIITYTLLSDSERQWYGGLSYKTYIVGCENYGWFPTEILMGITNHKFDSKHPKSLKHGASIGVNTGTMNILVEAYGLEETIKTLKENGYNVKSK